MDYIDEIYDTLMDDLVPGAAVPWVASIWDDGVCGPEWENVLLARERICARLGVSEDPDVEQIIDAMMRIQRRAARRMFLYGMRFRNEE
jgi:hypothetical protein